MNDQYDVIVVGGGQAGLATAHHLRRHHLRFLVVDAAPELGHAWRTRWDSLRLFTPAEHDGLPGLPFPAPAGSHPIADAVRSVASVLSPTVGPVEWGVSVKLEIAWGRDLTHDVDIVVSR